LQKSGGGKDREVVVRMEAGSAVFRNYGTGGAQPLPIPSYRRYK
jgi:hypothetical protein